jgi:hypothetical protein
MAGFTGYRRLPRYARGQNEPTAASTGGFRARIALLFIQLRYHIENRRRIAGPGCILLPVRRLMEKLEETTWPDRPRIGIV